MLLVLVTGGTVLLISTDVILALISLSFVPIIAVRSAIARMQLRYLWLKQQERLTVLTNAMEENLTGIRIVRALQRRPTKFCVLIVTPPKCGRLLSRG